MPCYAFNEHFGHLWSVDVSVVHFLSISYNGVVTWFSQVQLDLSFREAVQGCSKAVKFQTSVRCQPCSKSFQYPL